MNLPIQGRYVTVGGTEAYYETSGENGPPILLLHTAGRDGRQWHGVMAEIGSRYTLVAPDLPGHGKSAPLPGNTLFEDCDAIADWLVALMAALGHPTFAVAGASIGGNLSILLALKHPRLTAAIAMQGADFSEFSEAARQMLVHPQINPRFSAMDFALSLVGHKALPEAREAIEWAVMTINGTAQTADLAAYGTFDVRARMGDITTPLLLVHGTDDWVVTHQMVAETHARATSSRLCRMISLDGIGHSPHMEAPKQVADMIDSFVQEAGVS